MSKHLRYTAFLLFSVVISTTLYLGCGGNGNEVIIEPHTLIIYINDPKSIAQEINPKNEEFIFSNEFKQMIGLENDIDNFSDTICIYDKILIKVSDNPNSNKSQTLFTFDFSNSVGLQNSVIGYNTALTTFFTGDPSQRYIDFSKFIYSSPSEFELDIDSFKNKKNVFLFKNKINEFQSNNRNESSGVFYSTKLLSESLNKNLRFNGGEAVVLFDYPIKEKLILFNYEDEISEMYKYYGLSKTELNKKKESTQKGKILSILEKLKIEINDFPKESKEDLSVSAGSLIKKIKDIRIEIRKLENRKLDSGTDTSRKVKELTIAVKKPEYNSKSNGIEWGYFNKLNSQPITNLDDLPEDLYISVTVMADGNVYHVYKLKTNETTFGESNSRFWSSNKHNLTALKQYTKIKIIISFYSSSMNISEKFESVYSVFCKNSGNCVLAPF